MANENVIITIYGADQICASCVGAPGSKDTYEWIQAAISRKYETEHIQYEYIDIEEKQEEEHHQQFVERVFEEDLFYPVVVLNGDIAAEGIIRLKDVYKALDEQEVAQLA